MAKRRLIADKAIKRGRGSGAGWTPFAAAIRCETPWQRFRKAMENGEVEVIEFGDTKRIKRPRDRTDPRLAWIVTDPGESRRTANEGEGESLENPVGDDQDEPPMQAAECCVVRLRNPWT